jgi:hypothetical protein
MVQQVILILLWPAAVLQLLGRSFTGHKKPRVCRDMLLLLLAQQKLLIRRRRRGCWPGS